MTAEHPAPQHEGDEGYRLDWTGGVHWDNPYRANDIGGQP